MLWSTHIDTGVEILKGDPSTREAAAATYFCSAGLPEIGRDTPAGRLRRQFSFVCAFHQHILPNNASHWTMSWVDVAANSALHFDSLWDMPGPESLQELRLQRHNLSKAAMVAWLRGSAADFHRPGAPSWLYGIGSKTMQKDAWSCGLQMLEVLRAVLAAGGRMEQVQELSADDHTLGEDEEVAWVARFLARELMMDPREKLAGAAATFPRLS